VRKGAQEKGVGRRVAGGNGKEAAHFSCLTAERGERKPYGFSTGNANSDWNITGKCKGPDEICTRRRALRTSRAPLEI